MRATRYPRGVRFLWIPVLLLGTAGVARAEHVYEDEHIRIRGNVPEEWVETAAELARALYPRLKTHFEKEPRKRELPLQLVLYPDRRSFIEGMRAAGHKDPKHARLGGFTDWQNGISRVWLQTDAFHTRRLVIHELVHQFHDKCQSPARRGKGAFWYREGLAEWFGWHRRVGLDVRFGTLDAVARGGTRSQVFERIADASYSPWGVAIGVRKADYADGLCLVGAFLGTKNKQVFERFRAWERSLLVRGGGTRSFEVVFREAHEQVSEVVRSYWRDLQVWEAEGGSWDERNELSIGRSGKRDAVLWARPGLSRRVNVTLYLVEGDDVQAGLRLATGKDHPEMAAVIGRGLMAILRRDGDQWHPIASQTTTISGANVRLSLRTRRGEVELTATAAAADGGKMALYAPLAAFGVDPGVSFTRVGLLVRNGAARFWGFNAMQR